MSTARFHYGTGDFKRAILLCALVGTWLAAINQGSELVSSQISPILILRVVLDYATPFAVSSMTGIMRNMAHHDER